MSELAAIDTQKLLDMMSKQEIHDVLARYARGVDRADAELLGSCYFDDAIEEHGPNYNGNAMDYIAGAMERLRLMGEMAHYVCNSHIELDGDTAWVESYVITFARFAGESGDVDTLTGGRLCDRFERREGEWKIAHRRITFDWNNDMPSNQGWCLGMFDTQAPGFHYGRKDREDLSYQRS
ncbi:nuclear transport factor 2 family protein [Congregibacter sp.]|uniref:nuclear transport factor 2 family protein n=1 Tax=Congregibacter sp. TaxID=2744308 RepID=UPI00385F335D